MIISYSECHLHGGIKMKDISRKHHYIPQFYLSAYTSNKTKSGNVYVFNVVNGRRFSTKPANVGAIRDFNRVNIEGEKPDSLEHALSEFEEKASQACRAINSTLKFPCDEDFSYVINLLCLIAIRNPRLRSSFNSFRTTVIHRLSDSLVSDKTIYEHQLKKAQDAGYIEQTNVSFEEMQQFILDRKYKIEFDPESNTLVEFKTFDKILHLLGRRVWSLLTAPSNGPFFICSDHPVVLINKSQNNGVPIGYGSKNTEIYFPLGPCACFYGVFEDPLIPVIDLDKRKIGIINHFIAKNAEQLIFSSTDSFLLFTNGCMKTVSWDCQKETPG